MLGLTEGVSFPTGKSRFVLFHYVELICDLDLLVLNQHTHIHKREGARSATVVSFLKPLEAHFEK